MNAQLGSHDIRLAALLLAIGLVAMTSASVEMSVSAHGDALYYFKHQSLYMAMGIFGALLLARIPLAFHERMASWYGIVALLLLAAVLVPGLGQTANNSTRWLALGLLQFQPSELAKPALILWLAAYMSRNAQMLQTSLRGLVPPLAVLVVAVTLLFLEPDFGTACLVAMTALLMMFLCGGHLRTLFSCAAAGLLAMGGLAVAAPYRLLRIQSFLDPWSDPYNTGYQLTQSLIAIGSGGLWGRGLGDGVQKHFYLPEVHTDFVFAVAAEELGLVGALVIIGLFAAILPISFRIARAAQFRRQDFAAAVAYGVGLWIGLQAFINIAVNMGALPTKGLALPLMSAGGSSLVATLAGFGLLWRVRHETENLLARPARSSRRRRRS